MSTVFLFVNKIKAIIENELL